MSQTFLLEPDIIAATENVMPDLNNDLVLAKNFLKQQSAATGDSLYDHLVDVVQKILSQRPPDVVDNFEQYSWEVKQEKFRPNFDLLNDIYLSPPQLGSVRQVDEMFRLVASKATKLDDGGEEEQELDLEEETYKPKIQDLIDHNYYFRQAFELKDMPGEGEAADEARDKAMEEQAEILGEGEMKEPISKEPVPPKIPPEPVSTWQPPTPIPVERPGQGINKKVYWVCNRPGEPWICLPDIRPDHIRVARLSVRCMTGDLDSEVITFPPFEGTEKEYLRAQIARIAAATSVSPQGFFTYGSGEEEEDLDLEEGGGDMEFNPNPYYQGHTLRDLVDSNLTYWVHHGRHILKQGRTLWWNPNAGMEEGLEEEEDEGPPPIEPEIGPSLFTSLAEDARIEGMSAWSAREIRVPLHGVGSQVQPPKLHAAAATRAAARVPGRTRNYGDG
ncbi:hypothetical protein HF086_009638 [Spodoptera exigua]|uniref:Uncharacterized protein n=1 Tax=Spodoptera exigua TaxID=7107 RepID=A0A922SM48_SPOEX|nr:hypothetical protein HF086_009638 [Spodoptera exigua]